MAPEYVWVVADSRRVRGVFRSLQDAKDIFEDQRPRFRQDSEYVTMVFIADEAVPSYTITRHQVIAHREKIQ